MLRAGPQGSAAMEEACSRKKLAAEAPGLSRLIREGVNRAVLQRPLKRDFSGLLETLIHA